MGKSSKCNYVTKNSHVKKVGHKAQVCGFLYQDSVYNILPNYRTFFFVQAGVNGFRILSGDHIPSGGQTAAAAVIDEETGEPEEYDYGKIKWFF